MSTATINIDQRLDAARRRRAQFFRLWCEAHGAVQELEAMISEIQEHVYVSPDLPPDLHPDDLHRVAADADANPGEPAPHEPPPGDV